MSIRLLIACLCLIPLAACGPAAEPEPAVEMPPPIVADEEAAPAVEMATAVPDEGAAEEGAVEVDDAGEASEAAGDAMAGTVTFVIDPTRSEARYEVGETFFEDNRFAVAVGRTTGISGAVVVDTDDPGASSVEAIEVDVNQLASDSDRRDNFIRERALGSNDFPTARFVGTAISGMPESPQEGEPVTFQLSGDLTVRDVTLPVTWTVTATLAAGELSGTATTQVLMSDYGIGPIQIMQLGTEDEVDLTLDFVAVRAE